MAGTSSENQNLRILMFHRTWNAGSTLRRFSLQTSIWDRLTKPIARKKRRNKLEIQKKVKSRMRPVRKSMKRPKKLFKSLTLYIQVKRNLILWVKFSSFIMKKLRTNLERLNFHKGYKNSKISTLTSQWDAKTWQKSKQRRDSKNMSLVMQMKNIFRWNHY